MSDGVLVPKPTYDTLRRMAQDYRQRTGAIALDPRSGPPPVRATLSDVVATGGVGDAVMLGSGAQVQVYNPGPDASGDVPIYFTAGTEVSADNGDDPLRPGQWEVMTAVGEDASSGLPPGSSQGGCGCGDCIKGTSVHDCKPLCGCINKIRSITWPEFTLPDGVTKWRIPAVRLKYDSACLWKTATFDGPTCTVDDAEVNDTYQATFDYAEFKLVVERVSGTACDPIYIEFCDDGSCDRACLCPWILTRGKFEGIQAPRECSVCIGTIPKTRNLCAAGTGELNLGESIKVWFPNIPSVAGDYELLMNIGENGSVPDEQLLPVDAGPANELVDVQGAGGKILHLPYNENEPEGPGPYNDNQYATRKWDSGCVFNGFGFRFGTCSSGVVSLVVTLNMLLEVTVGETTTLTRLQVQWSRESTPLADIKCGNVIVVPLEEAVVASGDCGGVDGGDVGAALELAEWPDLEFTACQYNPAATSSGHDGSSCGDEDPCESQQCVLEVVEASGVKAWVAAEESTCDGVDCGDCFSSNCNQFQDDECGDASDHDVGYQCTKACAPPVDPAETLTVEFTGFEGATECECGVATATFCHIGEGVYSGTAVLCGQGYTFTYYEDGGTYHFDGGPENATSASPSGNFYIGGYVEGVCTGMQATVNV